MFGPFTSSAARFGGYLWKIPYKMSQSRKRHIRERLKNVENTMNILNSLGIHSKSLDRANLIHRYSHLSPLEKYTYFSKKHACRRPVHLVPKYTKVEIDPRAPYGYK